MGVNTIPLIFAWKHLHVQWRDEDVCPPNQGLRAVRLMQGDREIPAAHDRTVRSLLTEDAGGRLPSAMELQLLEMSFPKWPKPIMLALHGITVLGAEAIADARTCAQHVLRESADCLLARQLASLLSAKSDLRCPFGVDAKNAPDVVGVLMADLRATNAEDEEKAESGSSTASRGSASVEADVQPASDEDGPVQCPNCRTIFKLPSGCTRKQIASKMLRCSRCQHRFTLSQANPDNDVGGPRTNQPLPSASMSESVRSATGDHATQARRIDLELNKRLVLAAEKGDLDTVRACIKDGADVSATDPNGASALYFASGQGHVSIVKILLENGADARAVNNFGESVLIQPATWGRKEIVGILIDNGADVNHRDRKGRSALIAAIITGQVEVVRRLLKSGADTSVEVQGITPMKLARGLNHTEIAALLEKPG